MQKIRTAYLGLVAELSEDRKTVWVGRSGGSLVHVHRLCRDVTLRSVEVEADLRGWIERNVAAIFGATEGVD